MKRTTSVVWNDSNLFWKTSVYNFQVTIKEIALLHYYCLWCISIHRGYTTYSNNVPRIHIEVTSRLPLLYVHFLFCPVKKILL